MSVILGFVVVAAAPVPHGDVHHDAYHDEGRSKGRQSQQQRVVGLVSDHVSPAGSRPAASSLALIRPAPQVSPAIRISVHTRTTSEATLYSQLG